MNGFTDAPSIKPDHATWNVTWTVLFQIQSFSGRFIFLHLSTSPRSDFPGSHGVKKNINELVLFQTRALQSFDIFYVSFHGIWKPCNEPETSGEWAHKCHKMAPVFHIEHSFIYFLLSEFFPLFVCFDKLWQLAKIHAHDNTCDRNVNTLRQNDVTWCYFLQGKQVELSLSCLLSPQKT